MRLHELHEILFLWQLDEDNFKANTLKNSDYQTNNSSQVRTVTGLRFCFS